jgi:hypothetical protein
MNNSLRIKKITLSGLLLAFTVICVFLAANLPTSRLSLYALSSLFVSIIVIEAGTKSGWAFYVASAILSVILVPRLGVIPFVVFFGIYGMIKYYVELLKSRVFEYLLKLVYFNICLVLGLIFLKEILLSGANLSMPVYILAAGLEVAFILYDYIYTLFIRFYSNTLKPRLRL